jgi:copper homeostasis protein CutC
VKNKVISHIIPSKDEFLLVCHKHFDKDLDVEHSLDEQFKIRIPAIIANGHTILDAL